MISKMQKIWLNIILVVGTYVVPLYIFNQSQDNSLQLEKIQVGIFITLFFGGIALTYLNYRNIITEKSSRWIWLVFEAVGILGVLYSAFALYIIYGFSHFGV